MDFRARLIVLVIFASAFAPALATDYLVGDGDGWKLEIDYTKWATGKEFYVGDRLIFTYNKDIHNVAKVNGSEFNQCSTPDDASKISNSGNDTIVLGIPGKKWYSCTISDHCTKGMKLVINVVEAKGPSPSPAPNPAPLWAPAPTPVDTSTATVSVSLLKSCAWILASLIGFMMIIA